MLTFEETVVFKRLGFIKDFFRKWPNKFGLSAELVLGEFETTLDFHGDVCSSYYTVGLAQAKLAYLDKMLLNVLHCKVTRLHVPNVASVLLQILQIDAVLAEIKSFLYSYYLDVIEKKRCDKIFRLRELIMISECAKKDK